MSLQAQSLELLPPSLGSVNVKFLLALMPPVHTSFIYFTSRHSPGTLAQVSQCFLIAQPPLQLVFYKDLFLTFSLDPCGSYHHSLLFPLDSRDDVVSPNFYKLGW